MVIEGCIFKVSLSFMNIYLSCFSPIPSLLFSFSFHFYFLASLPLNAEALLYAVGVTHCLWQTGG
jgi:hypothetical protein